MPPEYESKDVRNRNNLICNSLDYLPTQTLNYAIITRPTVVAGICDRIEKRAHLEQNVSSSHCVKVQPVSFLLYFVLSLAASIAEIHTFEI